MNSYSNRAGQTLIEAQGLEKAYHIRRHEIQVLRGASLTLRAGETVAVVGASGAGKSTLLHILGGLDEPDAGSVQLAGESLYSARDKRRARLRAEYLGFVFQSYHLLPEMDVFENVVLPSRALAGRGGSRLTHERALHLLDSVGLADRRHHRPQELSGGEQQRVALARALMNAPPVILADEPTGNLDDVTGAQIMDRLFAISTEAGHGLVMVTHSRETAGRCDRTLYLRDGVLQSGAGCAE